MKRKLFIILEVLCIICLIICFFSSSQSFWFYLLVYVAINTYKKHNKLDKTIPTVSANIIEKNSIYKCKKFLTTYELAFYKKLISLEQYGFIIIPQVNLASIIEKENSRYRSELFRNIDFGVFDKDFDLKLLIELNDKTHKEYNRRDRDLKIKKVLNDCNIKLLNFYSNYPNEQSYVINRVLKEIEKIDNISV